MLINSVAALGPYAPSNPTNCNIYNDVAGTTYNAGAGGKIRITSSGSTDAGRSTINFYYIVLNYSGGYSNYNATPAEIASGVVFSNLDITKTYSADIQAHTSAGYYSVGYATSSTLGTHSAPQGISTVSASVASTTSVNLSWNAWSNTSSNPYADYASTPSNGNLAITGYKVEIYDPYGANPAYPVSTVTFDSTHTTGGTITYAFTKAHPYFFFLSAINADGLGYGKSSNLVTPNP